MCNIYDVKRLRREGKRLLWTEDSLAAFIELYPVTANGIIAEALGVSIDTVRAKANELSLSKTPRHDRDSLKQEVAKLIQVSSIRDVCEMLSISAWLVKELCRELNIEKTPNQITEHQRQKMRSLVKRERARAVWGFEPLSRRKVFKNTQKVKMRYRLKKAGYVVDRSEYVAYYYEKQIRCPRQENLARKLGFTFLPISKQATV